MSLTASFSVNGIPIREEDLCRLEITRKDYIDYVEALKKKYNYQPKYKQKIMMGIVPTNPMRDTLS